MEAVAAEEVRVTAEVAEMDREAKKKRDFEDEFAALQKKAAEPDS